MKTQTSPVLKLGFLTSASVKHETHMEAAPLPLPSLYVLCSSAPQVIFIIIHNPDATAVECTFSPPSPIETTGGGVKRA